ncbi:ABC-type multidrug transport system, ATPase and permease components [Pseudomonas sp. LAMO17WK12:I10]|uniref:ATP-binding cassette domain-containing protein n=1 Tax=unclassified Pseudomonas TaxID=196821 RepID=UPI000BC687A8|nr:MULTISPECIES: ABC transporter ATP-binding protein [unclassified Pseudomonas]PXX70533.1 KAP-like P-loop domain-containing protein [Pseudomonas sp. LAMO17WK12:I9]SNY31277.1 ABC-type multidrug transport system, ATPase and permease components [Pseudomonas sp. LAMO17WK12:I10]
MFTSNRYFISGIVLIISQQVSLGISTYYIAMAGAALSLQDYQLLKTRIILFFSFALLGYLISSAVEFISAKLKIDLWEKYIFSVYEHLRHNQPLSSEANRKNVQSWLGSEVPTTLDGTVNLYFGMTSVYSNIIATLYVFYWVLGTHIAILMASSILISYFLVKAMKSRISASATEIQQKRLNVVKRASSLWDYYLNANSSMIGYSEASSRSLIADFLKSSLYYTRLEQLAACLPISIAVAIILIYLQGLPLSQSVPWGMIVAVLPRSLQVFGNVHSMSLYNSKYVYFRKRISNLLNFTDTLEPLNLNKQVVREDISICNTVNGKTIPIDQLLDDIRTIASLKGRFLVSGKNGSGKSSFLKLIKSEFAESILLPNHVSFHETDAPLSTGESQVQKLLHVLNQKARIILLDEWDANLDSQNKIRIGNILSQKAEEILIIEVRHIQEAI